MSSYAPEAAAAIGAMVLLLIWCGKLMWDNRRARQRESNERVDRLIKIGMQGLERSGRLKRIVPEDLQ